VRGGSVFPAAPNKTAEDTVFAAFHILNQYDIPKGSVMNSAVGEPTAEITEWTSVADLQNLRWYFRTREDQSIRMVDLKEALTAAKGDVAAIEMEVTRQPYANVSGEAKKLDQAAN
jgi:choloylglycine hydrolase